MESQENSEQLGQALIEAAKNNNFPEVQRLIQEGADVHASDDLQKTALMYAAAWKSNGEQSGSGDNLKIVRALLAAGSDVNKKSLSDEVALFYALQENNLSVLECLLAAGASDQAIADLGLAVSTLIIERKDDSEKLQKIRACYIAGFHPNLDGFCISLNKAGKLVTPADIQTPHATAMKQFFAQNYYNPSVRQAIFGFGELWEQFCQAQPVQQLRNKDGSSLTDEQLREALKEFVEVTNSIEKLKSQIQKNSQDKNEKPLTDEEFDELLPLLLLDDKILNPQAPGQILAFAFGQHRRLGALSSVHTLPREVMSTINAHIAHPGGLKYFKNMDQVLGIQAGIQQQQAAHSPTRTPRRPGVL